MIWDFCRYSLPVEIGKFQIFSMAKFSPCYCKSKITAHLKLSAKMPYFNMCEMKQSFWKSVKYLWRYGIFAGTVYLLKVENFKFFEGLSFHIGIAKVKYLRTWNFWPKCRLSQRLRRRKVFENRSITFGDMEFLLVQFREVESGKFQI